jgi:uncharacterized protein (TIGR03382 family)
MEITGPDGEQAGLFSALAGDVDRPPGEELVVARGELSSGATRWTFDWTAPPAGSGPLRLHLAGVDGDGAGDRLGRTGDPFGDDVFVAALDLTESGTAQEEAVMTGCSTTGSSSGVAPLLAMLLLVAVRRRRRRLLLLPLLLAGCHDPIAPYDDCGRAICGLEPPPGEDAGRRRPPPGEDAGPAPGPDGSTPIPPGEDAAPGGEADAGVPPVGCTPRWVCTTFATACDGGNEASRTCTDEAGCGSDWGRPPLTTTLPALDVDFYRCRVQPVFDRLCAQAACHGAEERPLRIYARGKWRMNERWRGNHVDGAPALTGEEWCRNYDSARSFDGGGAASELVTQPLDPLSGGLPHAGFTLFYDTADPELGALRDWLDGAALGSCDTGFN